MTKGGEKKGEKMENYDHNIGGSQGEVKKKK